MSSHRSSTGAILFRHQHHGHDFVDTTQSARVDLAVVDRLGLEQLLEHDTVLAVFAGRHTTSVRFQCLSDSSVAENIVR